MNKLRSTWLSMSIATKMKLFIGVLMATLIVAASFNIYAMNYAVSGVGQILSDTMRCTNAQEAMEREEEALRNLAREQSEDSRAAFEEACLHTQSTIDLLPYDYAAIGAERFARTWNVKNSYTSYRALRDLVAGMDIDRTENISDLYRVYDMQNYIEGYIRVLAQETAVYGSNAYETREPLMRSMPYILILILAGMGLLTISMGSMVTQAIVTPVRRLARSVRKITAGDFSGPDISVSNKDELGALVETFNSMKHSTENNIQTLQENQMLSEQLHREEIERVEMEKRLDTTRLDLLQSQINPHFLFNTLNTISGMAEIEEAETTDQMIRALSSIFRYNLHTTSQFISLAQELAVAKDYLYLQKMRFGDRLQYDLESGDVDTNQIMVPVFILQPLIENAVTHGVNKKEQGGEVRVRVSMPDGNVHILVEDTGVGMTTAVYDKLLEELCAGTEPHENDVDTVASEHIGEEETSEKHHVGIGVGNIYKRIHSIYKDGEMKIQSTEGVGTTVELVLPQDQKIPPADANQAIEG